MRERVQNAPWWAVGLVAGLFFGVLMWVTQPAERAGRHLALSVVTAVLEGAVFGAVMGVWIRRARRRLAEAAGPVPPERLRAASCAAQRGRVPDDPAERQAAARLNQYWLSQYERQRWWGPLVFLFAIASSLYFAVTDSLWWVLGAASAGAVLAFWLIAWRRLRRRARVLAG